MRRALRTILFPCITLLLLSPGGCRKAEGVPQDPLDREADQALTAYLRVDTSNPPGNETAGARFLQQMLAREGIDAKLIGRNPRRQSLYARLPSGTSEKALLLLSHIDVVPAVPAEWTRPPFGGVHAGGYVWGRGALDIKSLTIAQAMAMIDLRRRGVPLRRDVILLATADEEAGGLVGCAELLDEHPELFSKVGFVLNEGGTNETVVDRVTFWGIEVQQKVPLWLRIEAKGEPGHAAVPPDDGGSSARLVRALGNILAIPTPFRLTPDVRRHLEAAGASRRDERGEVMRDIAEEIGRERVRRVLSPSYRALLRDTIAITRLEGGTSINSLPAASSALLDIRILPDATPDAMLERIRAAVGKDAEVEVLVAGVPAEASPADTELFRVLEKRYREDEPGSRVAPIVGGGATDSRFFRSRGIVAYGIAPFKVNYYDAGTTHGPDERIRLEFFLEGVRLMRRIVTDFCASAGSAG